MLNTSKLKQTAALGIFGLTLMTSSAFAKNNYYKHHKNIPTEITFEQENLFPEDLAYDHKTKSFLVGSLSQGNISRVYRNGTVETFIEDDALISSIGILIDKKRQRLIVCNSDPGVGTRSAPETVGKLAAVLFYDLKSGEKIMEVNLGKLQEGSHFANDLTLDHHGNVYVTDSFSPLIYKVTPEGEASIFLQSDEFNVNPGEFGMNGLVYHPHGFLIVAKYNEARLFKVPIHNPEAFAEIEIENKNFNTIDGLLLMNNRTLALVNNGFEEDEYADGVYKLKSKDQWNSARSKKFFVTGPAFPTTVEKVGKNLFVIHAKLNKLFSGQSASEFKIQKVVFD